MKHKHYDMIVAKAANMNLVVFRKTPESDCWEACRNDWMPTDLQDEFFLCLPQHKEACLHWLNGGGVLVKDFDHYDVDRVIESSAFSGWHKNTIYMSKEARIRIKPKKEKRWIGVDKYLMPTKNIYRTLDELQSVVSSGDKNTGWQFIEIEVEV